MTLAPTATDRGGETRRRILEVAAEAFADRGYAGTSLSDVLKASGVTKGGFYFHFPSKEALALATLRHKQEQWAGQVMAAVLRHPRPLDQLEAMVEALCDLHEQDRSCRAISRLCTELGDEHPELRPQLGTQLTTWMDMVASLGVPAPRPLPGLQPFRGKPIQRRRRAATAPVMAAVTVR